MSDQSASESFEVLPFYRGVSTDIPHDRPSVQKVRRDRRPRDSKRRFHEYADDWLERRFGVRYRSAALFVTSDASQAANYAEPRSHVVRILPLDEYKFCWSPNYRDLIYAQAVMGEITPEKVADALERGWYREDGLRAAFVSGNEVMLYCKRYIAIPISLLGIQLDSDRSIIVE